MDPDLALQGRRLSVSRALTKLARRRFGAPVDADSTASGLLALARRLHDVSSVERNYGVQFEPGYPGVTPGPEPVGSRFRLVFACRALSNDGEPLGVAFTVLIPGRAAEVVVGPPTSPIAPDWRPLAEYL